jgi:hypothetical protein
MAKPDPLERFNECLSIIQKTRDDKEAARVVLVAIGFLRMADEEFARYSAPEFEPASTRTSAISAARALWRLRCAVPGSPTPRPRAIGLRDGAW